MERGVLAPSRTTQHTYIFCMYPFVSFFTTISHKLKSLSLLRISCRWQLVKVMKIGRSHAHWISVPIVMALLPRANGSRLHCKRLLWNCHSRKVSAVQCWRRYSNLNVTWQPFSCLYLCFFCVLDPLAQVWFKIGHDGLVSCIQMLLLQSHPPMRCTCWQNDRI
jgi:hypothetical protein